MPELPEVETVRLGLAKLVIGKNISKIDVLSEKSMRSSHSDVEQFVVGSSIIGTDRRGKLLILHLSSKYSLLIHLRMTGQMVYVDTKQRFGAGHPSDSLVHELPDNTTRIICHFGKVQKLYFNDLRKFGYWQVVPTPQIEDDSFVAKLGPEPFSQKFTFGEFDKRLNARKGTTIKAALLDQTVLAGVGNIYADEALFAAKIHPSTRGGSVSRKQREALRQAVLDVMKLSIDLGGSSDKNYVNAEGRRGSYLQFAKVFRREGKPCPVCNTIIEKIRVAGRGTHICPTCQKISNKKGKKTS